MSQASEYLRRLIISIDLPPPRTEWRFHPRRKWRLDLAWPRQKIAVEIEGGIWMQTRTGRSKGHAHPKRFLQDIEKYNEASLRGWRLFRVTPEMIRNGEALNLIERIFDDS